MEHINAKKPHSMGIETAILFKSYKINNILQVLKIPPDTLKFNLSKTLCV